MSNSVAFARFHPLFYKRCPAPSRAFTNSSISFVEYGFGKTVAS
jgi:hypothetical protein